MANCPNCNAPLEDDVLFCANCGAAVVPAEAPSPASVAASSAPEAAAPAPDAAAPAPAYEPAPAPDGGFCPNCGAAISGASDYCENCGAALSMGGGQPPKKAGGSGLKKWIILGGAVVVVAAIVIVLISIFGGGGGGKGYGLYIKDKEMYYTNLSQKGSWQVTSRLNEDGDNSYFASYRSNFSSWTAMSKDGKTLFFPDRLGSGGVTLYYRSTSNSKKDATKIDSDITRYTVNDNASLVTYLKNGNLYQFTLSRDEKEKLAGDVTNFYVSDDGKKIIFRDDDDTLYQLDSGKDKVKLDSDVDYIRAVSDDCKTVIYQKEDTLYLKQDGKEKVKIASDIYSVVRAYDTGAAYYTKEDDDEYTLYYFDGKDSEELTDECDGISAVSSETPVLVYKDVDEVYWLASAGKITELDAEEPTGFTFSDDGKSVWYVDEPDRNNEGELYLVTVSNGTAKKAEKQDEDVYASFVGYTDGGHLIYCKDVKDGEGELYVDGKKADDDVLLQSVQESESGALLYYTDYNSSKGYGTLKQYSGGKSVKVADDVSQPTYLPNGSILYLSDYSTSRFRGDLFVYSGSKSTQLDEDVPAIIPIYSAKYKGN